MAKNYMLLYGKNSITERLRARPGTIRKIVLSDKFKEPEIEELIEELSIPTQRLRSAELAKKRPAKDLQGIYAHVDRYEYTAFADFLARAGGERPTLVFLDRVTDPHNLGVILRTTACFGGFAVVIPQHEACDVNETVLHVASGGENYTAVAMVTNISNAISKAKNAGYWIVGAVVDEDALSLDEDSLPFPLGLVLGSEGSGIRYGIAKHLDMKVRIPMEGARLSFNVNMACAILCHEICRQRRGDAG